MQAAERGGKVVSTYVDGCSGGDSHSRGETISPCTTSTAVSPLNHDSHDSHSMHAQRKIPNLDEKSYDVGYNSDGDIVPFYDAFEDDYNPYLYEE